MRMKTTMRKKTISVIELENIDGHFYDYNRDAI